MEGLFAIEQSFSRSLDREGEFEPLVVKKHQKNVTGIEDQILDLYANGVSTRDIQDHLQQLYEVEVSPTPTSNITNKRATEPWSTGYSYLFC